MANETPHKPIAVEYNGKRVELEYVHDLGWVDRIYSWDEDTQEWHQYSTGRLDQGSLTLQDSAKALELAFNHILK